MSGRRIHVVAGVLHDAEGRVLVARRPRGTHLAGRWEFPGGKLVPGESREAGLARELAEELGIRVLAACPLIQVEHRYPDRDVVLDVWSVESYSGDPHGREGQPVEWREVRSLDAADFPPADAPVFAALRLPRRYLVTPEPGRDRSAFLDRLAARVDQGFDLVQLRAKSLEEPALVEFGRRAAEICRRGGATLLVNAAPEIARRCGADGVHLTSRRLADMLRERSTVEGGSLAGFGRVFGGTSEIDPAGRRTPPFRHGPPAHSLSGTPIRESDVPPTLGTDSSRRSPSSALHAQVLPRAALPTAAADRGAGTDGGFHDAGDGRRFLTGASCHDAGDLERARAAGCDFAVLGPVWATPTHPGAPVLQWGGFGQLARGAGMPVFAIGGLGDGDVAAARRSGGQGVAAIRAFW